MASTGPKSKRGLKRSQKANWKHGIYSAEAKAERQLVRSFLRDAHALMRRF